MTTENLARLFQRYAERFGEAPPTMQLPSDPAEQARLIRAALDAGSTAVIDRLIPPDAAA